MTKRELGPADSGERIIRSRPIAEPAKPPKIYVRKKSLKIKRKSPGPVSGSLYQLEDPRNVLLTEKPRGLLGSVLDIEVESMRQNNQADKEAEEEPQGGAQNGRDELESTLLKALPELDPGENKPVLLKNLKMRVVDRLPNGDVFVTLNRSSANRLEANSIAVKARIPALALTANRALTTKDLYDVEWAQSDDGEVIERKSSFWEDEYTLRLSGFDEAKSKAALALEDKRKSLEKVKDQLKSQIKNMTDQRVAIAKERARLNRNRQRRAEERQALKDEIQSMKETLKERDEKIKELELAQAEEKPEPEEEAPAPEEREEE